MTPYRQDSPAPVVIHLKGHIPSKKNSYTPRPDGRGFFKDSALQAELDRLALQIPGNVRDLKLESPEMEFHFTFVRANWDRDNATQTLIDLLVQYGVLKNDNIASFNGKLTIYPAVRGEYDSVRVVLIPATDEQEHFPKRYINPRRNRRLLSIPHVTAEEASEELPMEEWEME